MLVQRLRPQSHIIRMSPESRFNMLPPIEGLSFSEEQHRYCWEGKWLPLSPTQILSIDLDEQAKQRINETKDGEMGWEHRGNRLHNCLEQHLLGAAQLDPSPFAEWWRPLSECWLFEDCKVMGVELRMTDKKRMGGSCDFLIEKDGQLILGDLKSVSSERALKSRKPASAQMGFYLMMMQKCWPKVMVDKCCTVISAPGKTKVITEDPTDCWLAYEDAMSRYQAHLDINVGF